MTDPLSHSMQALQRLMRAQEVTANNLANLNTPGFKSDKLYFHSILEEVNGRIQSNVVPKQVIDMSQGHFTSTGNPFDLAIEGKGLFKVELNGEELLTRNGRFKLDADGFLVNEQGANVLGESGPVFIPPVADNGTAENENRFEISSDGTIIMKGTEVDRISLVAPEDMTELKRHSTGYFVMNEGFEALEDPDSSVLQGHYEAGNVNSLKEMINMMTNAGMFDAQQKIMTTTDELLSRANNTLARF